MTEVSAGQLSLDEAFVAGPGRAHADGHDTEYAAAASVGAVTGRMRTRVYGLLLEHRDGLTDDEGGRLLARTLPGADRLTFGRRRNELYLAGLVRDSGARRATPRGRSAIVWRAVRRER
jgi:hypothetical protein